MTLGIEFSVYTHWVGVILLTLEYMLLLPQGEGRDEGDKNKLFYFLSPNPLPLERALYFLS